MEIRWIKIADNIDEIHFNDCRISTFSVKDKKICIIQAREGLRCCSSKCPHAGADLSEGFLDNRQNIICPVHGYRFNLNHGRDSNGEGYFLKIYPIKSTEEGVFVALE